MDYGTIERELHIDASPEVVFEVISSPEHVAAWWPDEAEFDAVPGGTGELRWRVGGAETLTPMAMTVIEVDPPRRFSFRWTHPKDGPALIENSLLVTFDLVPAGSGTSLRMTEVGFREQGWEIAKLEAEYAEHVTGWDHYLPRLGEYAAKVAGSGEPS
jgi:uncharacterized protein YndB with AHSA1/START domain